MPLGVAPSAVAVIADAQPLPCAACLCGKEGEGERERGGGEGVDSGLCVCSTYDPSNTTKGDVYNG